MVCNFYGSPQEEAFREHLGQIPSVHSPLVQDWVPASLSVHKVATISILLHFADLWCCLTWARDLSIKLSAPNNILLMHLFACSHFQDNVKCSFLPRRAINGP